MNRERCKELLPIIQAFAEGKTIQVKQGPHDDVWHEIDISPVWYDGCEYRIAPEPMEIWVNFSRNSCLVYTEIDKAIEEADFSMGIITRHFREVTE